MPNSSIHISVIIPTYQPGPYLRECLAALCRQTYSAFEVIVVLNGSNEKSKPQVAQLMDEFGSQLQMRLVETPTAGVSNARNLGIEAAHGKWLYFLDDDDYLSPTALETMARTPYEAHTIVCCNVVCVDDEGTESIDYLGESYRKNANQQASLLSARSHFSTSCCKLIPRELIGDIRFDSRFAMGEDSLFMAAIAHRVRNIIFTEADAIYYRRLRQGSASRSAATKNKTELVKAYTKIWMQHPMRQPLFMLTRIAATMLK